MIQHAQVKTSYLDSETRTLMKVGKIDVDSGIYKSPGPISLYILILLIIILLVWKPSNARELIFWGILFEFLTRK